jgi:hypothetical protein
MKNKKGFGAVGAVLVVVIAIFIGIAGQYAWQQYKQSKVDSFESCKAAGNPIMESYPEQCSANGKTYTNPAQQVDDF